LLKDDGFQLALAWSAALTVAEFVVSRFPFVRVGFGIPAVLAALIALDDRYEVPNRLVLALALLAVGGGCASLFRSIVLRVLLVVPGATFVAVSLVHVPGWVKVLAFVAVLIGAPLVAASDRWAPRPTPPLFLFTVLGVYACVPDTEYARILVGAFAAASFLAFDPKLRAESAGICAAVGLVSGTRARRARPVPVRSWGRSPVSACWCCCRCSGASSASTIHGRWWRGSSPQSTWGSCSGARVSQGCASRRAPRW
jgi:hypothetical protein